MPTNNTQGPFGAPDLNPMITGAEGADRLSGRPKALVLDDTNNLLGRPLRYPADDVFGKLNQEGDRDGTHLQFPIQLGDADVQNFLLFKIYNGHSEQYYKLERQIQELESIETLVNEAAAWQGEGPPPPADFQRELVDGIMLSSNQIVQRRTGPVYNEETGQDELSSKIWITPINGPDTGYEVEGIETELKIRRKQLEAIEDKEKTWYGTNISPPQNLSQAQSKRIRKANTRQKETIALYMPHKLNVANFNTYETPDFKLLNQIKGMLSFDAKTLEAMAPVVRTKIAQAADAGAAIMGAELNLASAIAAAEGRVENPRKETLYQSPELRKFEFAFEFAPRNLDESKLLYEIVKTLKHHAYPSLAGAGYYFNMPAEFELEFYSIINGTAYQNVWLNKIARCVLQEINIDYTAAGVVSFFHNGAPTNVNMTLTFQEVELITQEKVDQGY